MEKFLIFAAELISTITGHVTIMASLDGQARSAK
jgi:hypothetical protein